MIASLIFLLLFQIQYTATVTHVTDGDTFTIITSSGEDIRIRLDGIDCPEAKQEYGDSAALFVMDLVLNKSVKVEALDQDRYGRTLARVYIGDICVNDELLKKGFAWHYKQYNKDPELAALENEARKKEVGLWRQSDPEEPWEWRKEN